MSQSLVEHAKELTLALIAGSVRHSCKKLQAAVKACPEITIVVDIKECNENKYWESDLAFDNTLEVNLRNYA